MKVRYGENGRDQRDAIVAGQFWDAERRDIRLFVERDGKALDVSDAICEVMGKYTPQRDILIGANKGAFNPNLERMLLFSDRMAEAADLAHYKNTSLYEVLVRAAEKVKDGIDVKTLETVPDRRTKHLVTPVITGKEVGFGVTYHASQTGRSEQADIIAAIKGVGDPGKDIYLKAKTAAAEGKRVEVFDKAKERHHYVAPNGFAGLRNDILLDGKRIYSAIEPELGGLMNMKARVVVAYAVSNDVSANLLEGEDALWLPQAKVSIGCFAYGPKLIVLAEPTNEIPFFDIEARIIRDKQTCERFDGNGRKVREPYRFNAQQIVTGTYDLMFRTMNSNDIHRTHVFGTFGAGAVPSNHSDKTYLPGDEWEIVLMNDPSFALRGGVKMIPLQGPDRHINLNYEFIMIHKPKE